MGYIFAALDLSCIVNAVINNMCRFWW